jgi:hypothetical protein
MIRHLLVQVSLMLALPMASVPVSRWWRAATVPVDRAVDSTSLGKRVSERNGIAAEVLIGRMELSFVNVSELV